MELIGRNGEDDSPPPDPEVWSRAIALVLGEHRAFFVSALIHQLTITARTGAIRAAEDPAGALRHFRKHNELIHGLIQEVLAAPEDKGRGDRVDWLEDRRGYAYGVGIGGELDYALEAAVDALERRGLR